MLSLVAILLLAPGCSQLKKRGELERKGQKSPAKEAQIQVLDDPSEMDGQDEDFQSLPPQISRQSAKSVGLVFGSGGARSLAYAGVIRSFQKNKINVTHIAATGWSSLIGASFALSGEVNGMDWKLYKLETLGLKFEKGFLGFGKSGATSKFNTYLAENFKNQSIESAKVGFSCASRSLGSNHSLLISSGDTVSALNACVPTPPFFNEYSKTSSPASLIKMAQHLRSLGAEIIVFVNVLDGSIQKEPLIKEERLLRFSWSQILESHEVAERSIKNSYSLRLSAFSIFDFSKRKALEAEGERQGDLIAQKLIRSYGL